MKITLSGDQTIAVSSLQELAASNAAQVRDDIRAALKASVTQLDLDLSGATFLDSSGLGVLISLHKTLRSQNGAVRLINPAPNVLQIIELTRLHRVFEIVRS